jgi:hypothetical protein
LLRKIVGARSDLELDCVSLALNLIPTEEQHILIKGAGKERFNARKALCEEVLLSKTAVGVSRPPSKY